MLNNLCIYSPASSRFYEIEFAQTSVIACQQLDPTTASCAYVVDSNMFIVRGLSRTGRRLLTSGDATYTSLDPACRDALVSEALPNTRTACQANFDSSRATLELLGLERQLPACSFCSLTDAIEAIRSNPIAVYMLSCACSAVLKCSSLWYESHGDRADARCAQGAPVGRGGGEGVRADGSQVLWAGLVVCALTS
jgi:hypothetical protein